VQFNKEHHMRIESRIHAPSLRFTKNAADIRDAALGMVKSLGDDIEVSKGKIAKIATERGLDVKELLAAKTEAAIVYNSANYTNAMETSSHGTKLKAAIDSLEADVETIKTESNRVQNYFREVENYQAIANHITLSDKDATQTLTYAELLSLGFK
jgi:hypothetical protein